MVYVRWSQIGKGKLHSYFFFFFALLKMEPRPCTCHVSALTLNYTSNPGICFLLKKDLISLSCLSESVMSI